MTYTNTGADPQSYQQAASRAIKSVHGQANSPFYGYLRTGNAQKIYLFPLQNDVAAWFSTVSQTYPDHDYAAVFSSMNLDTPVPGLEHFASQGTTVGCGCPHAGATVGNWLPLALGLPLAGVAGYFLRRWQEQNPGRTLPLIPAGTLQPPKIPPTAMASTPSMGHGIVGNPLPDNEYGYGYPRIGQWVDIVGQGAPAPLLSDYLSYGMPLGSLTPQERALIDDIGTRVRDFLTTPIEQLPPEQQQLAHALVGASASAAPSSWPQTKALIDAAIGDIQGYVASYPTAAAYVWTLDAPSRGPYTGSTPGSVVMLDGTTNIVPFSSQPEALAYLREVAQTHPVAMAMFERSSPHWPNPTAWRKSDSPDDAPLIAQFVASRAPGSTQMSGTYAGAVIGSAIDDVRARAQDLAAKRDGAVVGVIHTSQDGLWHTIAFRSLDDADDWFGSATQNAATYTYAAYFDKNDVQWPYPINEKIGGAPPPRPAGEPIRRDVATTSGWR
jgi:hypothetical protein